MASARMTDEPSSPSISPGVDDFSPSFAVLGYGRFGRAFSDLLLQAGWPVRVYDPQTIVPAVLAEASLAAAVTGVSWVVLAMPVPLMRAALQAIRPHLQAGQTVIDVGSVKLHPCALMNDYLGTTIAHAGTHPLFGPLSLARNERPLRVVICASTHHALAAERTRQLFTQLGCEVVDQDPETHDRLMARTHALAFFVAKGLVDIGVDEGTPLAPPSFAGMKNMLAAVRGDAGHLFAAIQQENPFAAEARAHLLSEMQRIHHRLLVDADGGSDLAIPDLPEISR